GGCRERGLGRRRQVRRGDHKSREAIHRRHQNRRGFAEHCADEDPRATPQGERWELLTRRRPADCCREGAACEVVSGEGQVSGTTLTLVPDTLMLWSRPAPPVEGRRRAKEVSPLINVAHWADRPVAGAALACPVAACPPGEPALSLPPEMPLIVSPLRLVALPC